MLLPSNQILTAAQMRRAEEELMDAGTSVDTLMQTAGRGAAEWVWRVSGGRAVTVLCGPGNNGGDGYVIAQALLERGGAVRVIAASEPGTAAARTARGLYHGEVTGPDGGASGEVLVDCLFGTGLTRALSAEHTALLAQLAACHPYRVAVDLPSGVDSDTGQPLGPGLPSFDLTLALGAWKPAHFLMPACAQMGALRLVPIGIGPAANAAMLIERPRLHAPDADAHKYRRGLLAIIGGAMRGAALLAASAAQGAGAGYVKLLGDVPAPDDLVTDAQPLATALLDTRINAVLVGPGLGRDATARERLTLAVAENIPAVLDADALTLLAQGPGLRAALHGGCVLTPHDGEAARLFPDLAARRTEAALHGPAFSKLDAARAAARQMGCVVLLKGADTVIADPAGRAAIHAASGDQAAPWLATAGAGDVLAGLIAGLLARGMAPFEAACTGAWLHAAAARDFGPGLIAEDLPEALPRVLRGLGV